VSVQDSDHVLLEQARVHAGRLLGEVSQDLDALRDAASEAVYAEGAALCEEVGEATRELQARIEAEFPVSS
jgi:hypothetical protein